MSQYPADGPAAPTLDRTEGRGGRPLAWLSAPADCRRGAALTAATARRLATDLLAFVAASERFDRLARAIGLRRVVTFEDAGPDRP